jgi:hypothetical protein
MSGRPCAAPLPGRSSQVRDVLDYSVDPIDLAAADRDGREGHPSRLEPVSSSFETDKTCIRAFSRVACHICLSRYNAGAGWRLRQLTGRLIGRLKGRAIAIDKDRINRPLLRETLRSDRDACSGRRLSSRSGWKWPQKVVSGVSSVHVSGHRADRAAPLSQPDTMRLRIDFRAKPDSIRPKTNPV